MTQTKKNKTLRQELRNNMPLAERILWSKLKSKQLEGFKFRRQYEVQGFIIDFYCSEKKLAIELDGESHVGEKNQARDLVREKVIQDFGIGVIRFSNSQIYNNLNGVLLEVLRVLKEL